MPITYLPQGSSLIVTVNIVLFFIAYAFFMMIRSDKKVKKYEKEISSLTEEIETLRSENEKYLTNRQTISQNGSSPTDIISDTPLGFAIINSSETLCMTNPMSQKILGIAKDEGIGKNYKEIIRLTDKDGKENLDAIKKALNGVFTPLPSWMFLDTKRGKIPIAGSASPTKNHEALFVFEDASERYKKENEERSFFSAAAHDLRTPLTAIRGFLELSLEGLGKQPEEKIRDMLTDAHSSVLHLGSLVNDLLSVSRIEYGHAVINREPFDITIITKEIIETNKILATKKGLMITHEIIEINIPKVFADMNKTKEIIQNLLSNAIKYTQQGGIVISHRVDGPRVITTVKDTGIGVSEENKRLLFKKFQQIGDSHNQPSSKSTGLGLYISKAFATMMGGDVRLEKSEPEQGSTFALSLPIFIEK